MREGLYCKTTKCPVCLNKVEITKVKSGSYRVMSRDSDFFTNYSGINPIFYEITVCENCGFAEFSDKFDSELKYQDIEAIQSNIGNKWNKRSFAGERSVDTALDAYKLVLLINKILNAKSSEFAKISIRIAWLYRIKEDKVKENEFLSYALNFYNDVYMNEDLKNEKLDEVTCMYMIAELSRRTNQKEEALKWFSKILVNPEAKKRKDILENTRDMIQLLREK